MLRSILFDSRAPHIDAASWEELCRAAVPRLAESLGAEFGPAQRFWSGSGPEWDVAAASADRRCTLVAEVKWSAGPATAQTLARAHATLVGKGRPPFAHGELLHAVFVPAAPRRLPRSLPTGVRVVDARAVLAALSAET